MTVWRPRRLIGYWRSDDSPNWPDPIDFVDEQWDRDEREVVGSYLSRGRESAGMAWAWRVHVPFLREDERIG